MVVKDYIIALNFTGQQGYASMKLQQGEESV